MSRTEGDVHLSITPFSFVAMVVDLLTPLCAANTIHILSEKKSAAIPRASLTPSAAMT